MGIDLGGNIPRICTAVADWWACIFFLQHMQHRFEIKKHVVLSIIFLPVMILYMQLTGGNDGALFNLCLASCILCIVREYTILCITVQDPSCWLDFQYQFSGRCTGLWLIRTATWMFSGK